MRKLIILEKYIELYLNWKREKLLMKKINISKVVNKEMKIQEMCQNQQKMPIKIGQLCLKII